MLKKFIFNSAPERTVEEIVDRSIFKRFYNNTKNRKNVFLCKPVIYVKYVTMIIIHCHTKLVVTVLRMVNRIKEQNEYGLKVNY